MLFACWNNLRPDVALKWNIPEGFVAVSNTAERNTSLQEKQKLRRQADIIQTGS
jgi:hypothetical protein